MERTEVTGKLKSLIEEVNEISIGDENEQLDIDSYTMMLVITYVKEELGVELDLENMDFDAFTSLNTFADLVLDKAGSQAAA